MGEEYLEIREYVCNFATRRCINWKPDGSIHKLRNDQENRPADFIQHNFMESQRFNAVKGFYDLHQIKYFDARYDFYYNNGIIKEWRPW